MSCTDEYCTNDAWDVWVTCMFIFFMILFFVSLVAAIVRCRKQRHMSSAPHGPHNSGRARTPVYVVTTAGYPQQQHYRQQHHQQVLVGAPQYGFNVGQQQYVTTPPPTYDQMQVQHAPPAYNVAYVNEVTTVRTAAL